VAYDKTITKITGWGKQTERRGRERRRTRGNIGVGRRGMDVNRSLRLVSSLVSHGFVFMNGFALVALREIVLSSLPTASILSLPPLLLSGSVLLRRLASRYYSQNGRRPRIDISHRLVGPGCPRKRERERERETRY